MNNRTLHDTFRHQLTNVHALTVLTVSLFEIIGYIVLVHCGIERLAWDNAYVWYGVVLPIAVNILVHLVARAIINSERVRRRHKNLAIIAAALVTSLVVAVIHKEYIVTSCAFTFPMVLSAMFNDRKLLNTSFVATLFILVCVGAAFLLDGTSTLTSALNLFILVGFAFVSYLCGRISINFSKQNYTTIEEQAEENDRLMEDVMHDQMTGLYNHNAFLSRLDGLIYAADGVEPLCVAMLDLDDFKRVNDTYGHDCGDEVLIRLAQSLSRHCSDEDTAYRYGGEEFAVIFPRKSVDEAHAVLSAVLADIRGHRFSFTDDAITFSAGIVAYSPDLTRDRLFETADQTLYRAKRQGKNRILIADTALQTV